MGARITKERRGDSFGQRQAQAQLAAVRSMELALSLALRGKDRCVDIEDEVAILLRPGDGFQIGRRGPETLAIP